MTICPYRDVCPESSQRFLHLTGRAVQDAIWCGETGHHIRCRSYEILEYERRQKLFLELRNSCKTMGELYRKLEEQIPRA